MEIIRGKQTSFMDSSALAERLNGYDPIWIDIGTGDGRFVQHVAQTHPECFVIGIDACRENLYKVSRHAPSNALFVIANAQIMPAELHGLAAQITINFPWGSLLEGLLTHERALLDGLAAIARPAAQLDLRLNGSALAEIGWAFESGALHARDALAAHGFTLRTPKLLTTHELKAFPTTWAKRLAFGRDPRAAWLGGTRATAHAVHSTFSAVGVEMT